MYVHCLPPNVLETQWKTRLHDSTAALSSPSGAAAPNPQFPMPPGSTDAGGGAPKPPPTTPTCGAGAPNPAGVGAPNGAGALNPPIREHQRMPELSRKNQPAERQNSRLSLIHRMLAPWPEKVLYQRRVKVSNPTQVTSVQQLNRTPWGWRSMGRRRPKRRRRS